MSRESGSTVVEPSLARRSWLGVRARLFRLVLACVVPPLVGMLVLTWQLFGAEVSNLEKQDLQTARALTAAVDRELEIAKATATVLADSEELNAGRLADFYTRAAAELTHSASGFDVCVHGPGGEQLLSTARPYGAPLPPRSDLTLIQGVFASRKPLISNLSIDGATGQAFVAVHVPVLRNGRVIYVLSIEMTPARLEQILSSQKLSDDRIAAVFDTQGVIAARTRASAEYVGRTGTPALIRRLQEVREDVIETRTLEGISVYVVFSRSTSSGWSVAIGVPQKTIAGEVLQSLMPVGIAISIGMLIGLYGAWRMGGRLSRSIRGLVHPALALGKGKSIEIPEEGLAEAVEVATALRQVEVELDEHRHKLEDLVQARTLDLARMSDKYRSMLMNSSDGIHVVNARGEVIEASDSFCQMLGYSRDQILGKHIIDLDLGVDADHASDPASYLLQRSATRGFETRYRCRDGRLLDIEIACCTLVWDGELVLFAAARDISERKQAERRLDMERSRLLDFSVCSADWFWEMDADLRFSYLSPNFESVYGLKPELLLGKTRAEIAVVNVLNPADELASYAQMLAQHLPFRHFDYQIQDAQGRTQWVSISGIPIKAPDGAFAGYRGIGQNITRQKEAEERIQQLAFYDPLTSLPNRRLLEDRLDHDINKAQRERELLGLLFIDLDRFKPINDQFGHEVGDWLLQEVAQRMRRALRASDTVARIGGDEFVALLPDIKTIEDVRGITNKIHAELQRPLTTPGGIALETSASIGVAIYPENGQTARELLRYGDEAMYRVKSRGR